MPTFKYRANDASGNDITGKFEAKDRDTVAQLLHAQGYKILDIDEEVHFIEELFAGSNKGIPLKTSVIITKQLSTMLNAGLSIVQALEIIVQQTKEKSVKRSIEGVMNDIRKSGRTLSDSVQKNTRLFNDVQINLLKAGEISGNLNEVLSKIAIDLEKTKKMRSRIKGAMIYPSIIAVVVFVVLAVMMIYMVPAVEGLYADFGVEELPLITRMLVSVSKFLVNPFGASSILFSVLGIFLSYKYLHSTEGGRLLIDKIILKMPIFGDLVEKIQIAEFSRLFALLIKSGVPILKSMEIVANALSNSQYKKTLLDCIDDVTNGIPLAVPLSQNEIFPPILVKMVAVGEETGKLDNVLEDMAAFYEEEVSEISDNLNKLMEPLILILVGGVVAFLALGIYLPLYTIGQNI